MTDRNSSVHVIDVSIDPAPGFGSRMGWLRWRRAFGGSGASPSPVGDSPARAVLAGCGLAVAVRDGLAISLPVGDVRGLLAGRILPALPLRTADDPAARTLREIETTGLPRAAASEPQRARIPAVGFDVGFFPPGDGETLTAFSARLFREAQRAPFDPSFCALVFDERDERQRHELATFFPQPARRLCDVRALGKDCVSALERLACGSERFDAFLFSGVLENLEDPVRVLALAREIALPHAALVAGVPNVGHVSLVRDLLLGRFDPLPEGLTDARHLRWFDRLFLRECLEEAGWLVDEIRGLPGVEPPESESFLSRFAGWHDLDRESLLTEQWVAVARAGSEPAVARIGGRGTP